MTVTLEVSECAGSGKPTNIVINPHRPNDFLCPVCGGAPGSMLSLAAKDSRWVTVRHVAPRSTNETREKEIAALMEYCDTVHPEFDRVERKKTEDALRRCMTAFDELVLTRRTER